MPPIRSIEQISRKWATVTPGRTDDYRRGVENPTKDWQASTLASEDSWQTGVTQAIAEKRFGKGVRNAGTQKWQQGASTKGVQRWGPGVQFAESAYAQGFAPIRDAIERVNLPPRFARRDPRNLQRVQAINQAIIEATRRAAS